MLKPKRGAPWRCGVGIPSLKERSYTAVSTKKKDALCHPIHLSLKPVARFWQGTFQSIKWEPFIHLSPALEADVSGEQGLTKAFSFELKGVIARRITLEADGEEKFVAAGGHFHPRHHVEATSIGL